MSKHENIDLPDTPDEQIRSIADSIGKLLSGSKDHPTVIKSEDVYYSLVKNYDDPKYQAIIRLNASGHINQKMYHVNPETNTVLLSIVSKVGRGSEGRILTDDLIVEVTEDGNELKFLMDILHNSQEILPPLEAEAAYEKHRQFLKREYDQTLPDRGFSENKIKKFIGWLGLRG